MAQEDAAITDAAKDRPGQTAPSARLKALQKAAARACLGADDNAPPASTRAQPPISVPRIAVPALPPAAAGVARGPAPVQQPPLLSITACDAAGCWASDGTLLQQHGPNLLGPRGFCTRQGTVLNCP